MTLWQTKMISVRLLAVFFLFSFGGIKIRYSPSHQSDVTDTVLFQFLPALESTLRNVSDNISINRGRVLHRIEQTSENIK